jgi:hypothetical protein
MDYFRRQLHMETFTLSDLGVFCKFLGVVGGVIDTGHNARDNRIGRVVDPVHTHEHRELKRAYLLRLFTSVAPWID